MDAVEAGSATGAMSYVRDVLDASFFDSLKRLFRLLSQP